MGWHPLAHRPTTTRMKTGITKINKIIANTASITLFTLLL